jgi:outer membrane protein assembly factor BamB
MWRHDGRLTGHQPLPGAMKQAPRVLARYFVGAEQGTPTLADLRGTGKKEDIIIAARARLTAYDPQGKRLWESAPAGYVMDHVEWVEDLDGDGHNEVIAVAGHMGITRQAYLILDGRTGAQRAAIEISTGDYSWSGHCGSYLPNQKGKQIFLVTSSCQAVGGPPASYGQFSLWSFDGSEVTQRWAWTPTEHVLYYPAVTVADLNGDGRFHAVVDSWCHVWNIDLATGAAVSHTTWDPQGANARQYGWNELVDVDGDGKLDFVNISRTKHVDVLRNVGGKLQLAWTHGWPDPVTTEARSLVCPSDPVVDLEGTGHKQIVCALFDGLTDKRWHLSICDAASGAERVQMPDLVPLASVPLWGTNGPRALLCARSSLLEYQPPEACEVWRLHDGKMEKLWSLGNAQFLLKPGASDDRRAFYFNAVNVQWAVTGDVDGDGRPEFFTRANGASTGAQAWGLNHDGALVAKPGQLPASPANPVPRRIPPLQGAMPPYLLAADLNGRKPNEIMVYDNTNVTVLRLEKNKLRRVEDFASSEIPVVCDLLGDGKPCLLTGGRGPDGNLWVQARDANKKTLWRFTFPHSGACGQYAERPHFFTVGHFTGGKHLDVFTYAAKPAARTYVLDGRTGTVVWQREDMPAIERHYQPLGGRVSVWDFNHDGADDVLFCNPDFYCVADGKSGNLLVGPVNLEPLLKWWAAYASPALLERAGAEPVVYLGGVYSCRASISPDGKRGLWREYLPTERWPMRAGNCGFNEGLLPPSKTRGWRGAQMEADGVLVCFDAATGQHLWRMQLPTATGGIISGDVDGDGEAELLFGGQDGNLLAVRDAGDHGEVLWRKRFDAPVGTPILADVNGDGKSEIVVSVGDGYVYVLGN